MNQIEINLNIVLSDLLNKYPEVKGDVKFVVYDSRALKNKEAIGEYHYKTRSIVVSNDIGIYEAVQTVCHEFRHAWQHTNHRDIYLWWLSASHRELYYKYYWENLNILEADAIEFGCSLGSKNKEWLFNIVTVDELNRHLEDGTMDDFSEDLNRLCSSRI